MRRVLGTGSAMTALIALAGFYAAGVAAAPATPSVCATAGVTASVVTKIFGATAKADPPGASQVGRCPIEAGIGSKPPTGCQEPSKTCTNTDVELQPASNFQTDITAEVTQLDDYGHASKTAVTGAGTGAVLLRSTNYGGVTNPLLLFQAGSYTVIIAGPFGGVADTNSVYRQWEALARVIHTHLA
jgi:hypothetical protein